MQVCDALKAGGLERVVVNIANDLPQDRFDSHLCTTRGEGAFEPDVAPHVGRLRLRRKSRFDLEGLVAFRRYLLKHNIRVVHAHGFAIFYAVAACALVPSVKVVWHDHSGRYIYDERPRWLYWLLARRLHAVISVNEPLADWARNQLHVAKDRVCYLPNYVHQVEVTGSLPDVPGQAGSRIVNVANFRREKDHPNLFRALRIVLREVPTAHVILLGTTGPEPSYFDDVMKEMSEGELAGHVTYMGSRSDVAAILQQCDVGVLASASEGLPLALIEYGVAGLASVSTEIGQCGEVLDGGKVGLLVPTNDSDRLAAALLTLLKSSETRADLGRKFKQRTKDVYSPDAVVGQIVGVYEKVLEKVLDRIMRR